MNTLTLDLTTNLLCFRLMGITEQTLRDFEAGYYEGTNGFLHRGLAVRLHGPEGQAWGYMGQSLDQWARAHHGTWKLPPGPDRAPFLYNWHRIDPRDQQTMIMTTGPWLVMKLFQAGYRQAVALVTRTICRTTIGLIQRSQARHICLFFGGDAGSRATAQSLKKHLGSKAHVVFLPEDILPDQLSLQELSEILEPYLDTTLTGRELF